MLATDDLRPAKAMGAPQGGANGRAVGAGLRSYYKARCSVLHCGHVLINAKLATRVYIALQHACRALCLQAKIEELEIQCRDKQHNLRRLEAQRNEVNTKGVL